MLEKVADIDLSVHGSRDDKFRNFNKKFITGASMRFMSSIRGSRLLKFVVSICVVSGVAVLASCGGGSSANVKSFRASAGVGELVDYVVDLTASTVNYTVLKSSYDLVGATGTYGLTAVAGQPGSYTLVDPNGAIQASNLQINEDLIKGAITLNLGGTVIETPVLGVANRVTDVTQMAGTYNVMWSTCADTLKSGCSNGYGTVKVTGNTSTGMTYDLCGMGNLTDPTRVCTGATTLGAATKSGTVVTDIDGNFVLDGGTNYLIGFNSVNGQTVVILDLNDAGGLGYGTLVGATQRALIGNISGTSKWSYTDNEGSAGVIAADCGASGSPSCTALAGVNVIPLVLDEPWAGLARVGSLGSLNSRLVLLGGAGQYASMDADGVPMARGYVKNFEVGVRQPTP